MKVARIVGTTALLVTLLAPAASGTHGGIHPTFRTENVYFHCTGDTKIYQVNWIETIGQNHPYTRWDANPPTQSVQEGAGCGGVDWGGTTNELYDVVFQDSFSGNLRDLTIRAHNLLLGNARESDTERIRIWAEVDGVPLFPEGTQPNCCRTVEVTPVTSSSGASELFEFSITNLGYATDIFDEEGELIDVETGGLALEDGDGNEQHLLTIYLGLDGSGFTQDVNEHKVAAWVWDTTEVPSGITFNPPTLAAARVAADLPEF